MKVPYFKIYLWIILISGIVILGLQTYEYFTKKNTPTNTNTNTDVTNDVVKDNTNVDNTDKPIIDNSGSNKTDTSTSTTTKTDTSTSTPSSTTNWWEYPSKIYNTTRSGNDLLVLVDKTYKLKSTYAPTDLVNVKQSKIRTLNNGAFLVRLIIISDLKAMNSAAKAAGIDLSVVSAYRSYSTQVSTYNHWVTYNNGCVSCADKISARPGHSQHQLGTAIDFSTSQIHDVLGSAFDKTKASVWLQNNGYKYGFVISYPKNKEPITGYSYESWHYRYIGRDNALKMFNEKVILENFLIENN